MKYKVKYLKYKEKYLKLKSNQNGGNIFLSNNIDYKIISYVIHMRSNLFRGKNIEEQCEKIGNIKLNIFDAVVGAELDIEKIKKETSFKTDFEGRLRGEIGVFLSHKGVLDKIKEDKKYDYTIIFEDDFIIKCDNLEDEVKKILSKIDENKLDFDIIYLGFNINGIIENTSNPEPQKVIDNICEFDYKNNIYGLHGLLIKNKNVDKILSSIKEMNEPIDVKYNKFIKNNILRSYLIYPKLINVNTKLDSDINKQ